MIFRPFLHDDEPPSSAIPSSSHSSSSPPPLEGEEEEKEEEREERAGVGFPGRGGGRWLPATASVAEQSPSRSRCFLSLPCPVAACAKTRGHRASVAEWRG